LILAFNYRIEENGVLYFLGDATPTSSEIEIIEEWKRLPVVTLVYDGPSEYEGVVRDLLSEEGVLTGSGTPLIVKIRTKENYVAFQLIFEEKSVDNFENLSTKDSFPEHFRRAVRGIFPDSQLPDEFFLVVYRDGKFERSLQPTATFAGRKAPVVIIPQWKEKHTLEIGNYRKVVDEEFYQIGGKMIYAGRDIFIEDVPGLYRNIDMVFLDGEKECIYRDGFLMMEEKILKIEEPVDVVDGIVITRHRMGSKEIDDTILFRWNNFVLTASGFLVDIKGKWSWKVSNAPVEFSFQGDIFYVLDVCGFLRSYNLKTRQLLWEKKFEGAWGLDSSKDRVFLGAGDEVLVLNAQDGETIERMEADDFAVWKGRLLVYKDGKVDGEDMEGFFIRNFGMPLFVSGKRVVMFGTEKKEFEEVEKVRLFDWGTVIKAGDELWLIRRD
jgi:outer membrane protein assembly factor BamB